MGKAKHIIVKPVSSADGARLTRKYHYSGKSVKNSQLHLGVFLDGVAEGVMQFGPSMDKRKVQGLVEGTPWNGFIELNRMAFSRHLPRNSESRALGVALRMIRLQYPHIQWVLSFADACQCGDGAIYRAAGFTLTGIKTNNQIIEFPDGLRETRLVLTDARRPRRVELANRYKVKVGGGSSLKPFLSIGAKAVAGYQLRYIYFIDRAARNRLTVPSIPFSKIDEMGAGMYKGKAREKQAMTSNHGEQRRGGTDLHAPYNQ